jgi:hypothetical protein
MEVGAMIKVTFRQRGTSGESDVVVESPPGMIEDDIQICGMGQHPDGGAGVMIEWEPDTRPPEVRAYDRRMRPEWNAQRDRGLQSAPDTPAEREARWSISVWFAIQAANRADARVILDRVLDTLAEPMPLWTGPIIDPGMLEGIWLGQLYPEPAAGYTPDDAENRCRWVSHYFGPGPTWVSCDTRFGVRWDWPPDIFSRVPGDDDMLPHPAVQAVRILCEAKQA